MAGTTSDANEVAKEVKYSIDDLLFGYSFMTAEVPVVLAENERSGAKASSSDFGMAKYRFIYGNNWKVVTSQNYRRCDGSGGVDMTTASFQKDELLSHLVMASRRLREDLRAEHPITTNEGDKVETRFATVSDASEIAKLMREAQSRLDDKSIYVISDEARVRRKLSTDCFGFVAKDESGLAAFALFQLPAADNREDNLGFEIGLGEDKRSHVLVIDSVAVRKDCCRRGLASGLLKKGETEGRRRGRDIFLATVDPRNAASRANFESAGYVEKKQIDTFAGIGEGYILSDSGHEEGGCSLRRCVYAKNA